MPKAADLSGMLAKKGDATSANTYPGDDRPKTRKPKAKSAKTTVQTPANLPAHLQIAKPERRADAINIRITPSEREQIEALQEALGGSKNVTITQILMLGLDALQREIEG